MVHRRVFVDCRIGSQTVEPSDTRNATDVRRLEAILAAHVATNFYLWDVSNTTLLSRIPYSPLVLRAKHKLHPLVLAGHDPLLFG